MKVLVCGGRDYGDIVFAYSTLDNLHLMDGITQVISGGASGADELAHQWALARGVPSRQFFAEWEKEGHAAGPIRNLRMLNEGKPDLVIAFPGGRGTADMVRRAKSGGVRVMPVWGPRDSRP